MDANKDDAIRCLQIAKDALDSGDRVRALKFLTKARRLDPSVFVDDSLTHIEGNSGGVDSTNGSNSNRFVDDSLTDIEGKSGVDSTNGSNSNRSKPMDNGNYARGRVPVNGSSTYTDEQVSIVREIKIKKDYYEILGLEKTCSTVDDIRKAYTKLSLKVHPHKNQAPGAEEAFKLVSKAFQCLSN